MEIKIGKKIISNMSRPYFIADIASNHDGDINRAYKLIELAKESGADAAKFQNFKANLIVSKKAFDSMPKQTHQKEWGKSVFDVYKEASVQDEWTYKLKEKCNEFDIEYMTSPYDFDSVDIADTYSNAFKIGSGDITWTDIIKYIAQKNKPVILSTGASTLDDVERAVNIILEYNKQLILMQCNTNYTINPQNYKSVNLKVLETYRKIYPDIITGLSDHTPGHIAILGALALGANVFEKHFTDDNTRIGPDHKFAMNPNSWKIMVRESNYLYDSLGDGIKKIEKNEQESRIVQQRMLYFVKDLKKGDIITASDIFPLRPIQKMGYYPYEIDQLLNKKICCDVKADSPVIKGVHVND